MQKLRVYKGNGDSIGGVKVGYWRCQLESVVDGVSTVTTVGGDDAVKALEKMHGLLPETANLPIT